MRYLQYSNPKIIDVYKFIIYKWIKETLYQRVKNWELWSKDF